MILDSNIIIAYLDGEGVVIRQLSEWKESGTTYFLPTIVESEVLAFNKWTEQERKNTENFLAKNFVSILFDRTIAHGAAQIRRESKIKFPDAAIAATALATGSALVTRNIRDFKKIPGLQLFSL